MTESAPGASSRRLWPSVTVIIPAFNSNDTLPSALGSLRRQSVEHDVLILDDGSDPPVAEGVDTADARVVRQPNGGVGMARRRAMELAEGDVVAFLDADDVWDTHYLERQLTYLTDMRGLAGVICAPHPPNAEEFVGRALVEFAPTLHSLRGGPGTTAWCFWREAILAAGNFDAAFRRMEDYELLIRMTGQGFSVLRHDEPLYRYLPSIERGNRYNIAQQRALERFAELYGDTEVFPWLDHHSNAIDVRYVRAIMHSRAMNVAALRGDVMETRRLADRIRGDAHLLPRPRRLMASAGSTAPWLYSAATRLRS